VRSFVIIMRELTPSLRPLQALKIANLVFSFLKKGCFVTRVLEARMNSRRF